jgi:acyl carrier protein
MADGGAISARDQISSIVRALLAKRTATPFIDDAQDLTDLGLTSLDMVNLMLAVEDAFEIEIPQRQMTPANFRSIVAIENLVNRVALAA